MPKKNNPSTEENRSAKDYYHLHLEAIDDLVHADASNSPEVSPQELAKYRSKHGIRLSDWVKVLLIKFWFNGSVCFFFFWGLGTYLTALVDQLAVLGIAMGIITDLLVNNILRFYAKTEGENDRWMMFPKKGYVSFPLNILYSFLVLFFVFMFYQVLNTVIIRMTGVSDTIPVGVGPIGFGLIYLGFDLMFLSLKFLFLRIVQNAKTGTTNGRNDFS